MVKLPSLFCPKRLPYIMNIFCNFLRYGKFHELGIVRKQTSLKSSKCRQKQEIDLHLFKIFKTTRNVLYFRLGIGKSVENIQSKFIVSRYLRIWSKCSL